MTFAKRIALTAILSGFSALAAYPAHAFMIGQGDDVAAVAGVDIVQTVSQLRDELQADTTSCDEMLIKIDGAIAQVDAALEQGVTDERTYIGLRDELVEMRLSLPCLADKLAQGEIIIDQTPIVDGVFSGDSTFTQDASMPANSVMDGENAGGGLSGSGSMTGGGGSTGGSGIGGSPLGIAGLALAIALPLALDDSQPGENASPSN